MSMKMSGAKCDLEITICDVKLGRKKDLALRFYGTGGDRQCYLGTVAKWVILGIPTLKCGEFVRKIFPRL
jgi:hypothetical protein